MSKEAKKIIIKWNGDGVKTFAGVDKGTVVVLPGNNSIKEVDWNSLKEKPMTQLEIKAKLWEEIGTKEIIKKVEVEVEKDGKKVKEQQEVKQTVGTDFKDIVDKDPEQALEIIKDTFNMEVLEGWRKSTGKDEIRAAIANQIDTINKAGTTGD